MALKSGKRALTDPGTDKRFFKRHKEGRFKSLLLLVFFLTTITACGGLTTEQKVAASDAMSALRKLESSSQVGVSYMQYGPLLVDGKAKVNEAAVKLPDGELKNELGLAIDAYERAGSLWNRTLHWGEYALDDVRSALTEEDQAKYSLGLTAVSRSEAMSTLWELGSKHIARGSPRHWNDSSRRPAKRGVQLPCTGSLRRLFPPTRDLSAT